MAEFRKDITAFMHAAKDVFEYIAPDILEISVDIAKKLLKRSRNRPAGFNKYYC